LVMLSVFLSSCSGVLLSQTPTVPRTLITSINTLPAVTLTASATSPHPSTTPSALPSPIANAAGLIIVTREIQSWINGDSLDFVTVDGTEYTSSTIGTGSSFSPSTVGPSNGELRAKVGNDLLTAVLSYNHDYSQSWVIVQRNGIETYRISTGPASPVEPLRGFWSYDSHWVLEVAPIIEKKIGNNGIEIDTKGQLIEDGRSLNSQYGYEEAFNFQTLGGRPFYFFQKNGRIDAWFDGQVVPLGYDNISHYGCCSAAQGNPRMFTNLIVFFGSRGQADYFVQISLP
jgi:hypothetical protein